MTTRPQRDHLSGGWPKTSSLRVDHVRAVLAVRSGRWYSACLRITRDADLADDAVQEALLKPWWQRTEFRCEAELEFAHAF